MKRLLLASVVSLLSLAPASAALVDYYTLENTTATGTGGLADQSGNTGGAQNLSTQLGDPGAATPTIVPGIIGNALSFPGATVAGTQVSFTSTTSFALAYPFTQSVWVQVPATANGTDQAINLANIGSSEQYFAVGTSNGTAAQIARFSGGPVNNTNANIANTQWRQLTGVYTSATSRTLYLDGKLVSTSTTSVALPSANVRLTIGALQRSTNT
jgi:hypothetical protein